MTSATPSNFGPRAPELEGTLLAGTYRVGKLLGQGGMGAVFDGVQESLGRPVAIKVLLDRSLGEADFLRFEREARAAAALGHANIVQVTDFRRAPPDPPFLVMEKLVGESLRAAIASGGALPAPRVAVIGSQVLDALAAAHRAGLVHRDIKPDNVFLTKVAGLGDVVKVLDFGIAKVVGDSTLTASGAMMGSPAYMSPEQATGGAVDARTDVYGVGITMYHALTGRHPYDAKSLPEMLVCILQSPPPRLSDIAPWIERGLAAVIERAMQKDPAARFASADEMRAALAPFTGASSGVGAVVAPAPPSPYAPSYATSGAVMATPATAKSGGGVIIGVVVAALVAIVAACVVAGFLFFRAAAPVASAPVAMTAPAVVDTATPVPTTPAVEAVTPTHPSAHAAPGTKPATPPTALAAAPATAPTDTTAPASPAHAASSHARAECHPTMFGPYDSPDGMRSALAAHAAAFTACASRACFVHDKSRDTGYDFEVYEAVVDASGAVKNVSHPGDSCAAVDTCIFPAIRTINFGPTKSPGPLQFTCGYFQ